MRTACEYLQEKQEFLQAWVSFMAGGDEKLGPTKKNLIFSNIDMISISLPIFMAGAYRSAILWPRMWPSAKSRLLAAPGGSRGPSPIKSNNL